MHLTWYNIVWNCIMLYSMAEIKEGWAVNFQRSGENKKPKKYIANLKGVGKMKKGTWEMFWET